MGSEWEVCSWRGGFPHDNTGSPYRYVTVYYGNSLLKAIIAMYREKKNYGCVKIEWR